MTPQFFGQSQVQTATKNLLAQLKAAAANNGDVYVSIIPFVEDVNIGNTNYNASWIEWTDWDAYNGSCAHGHGANAHSCNANHGTWAHKAHNIANWNGCVTDRGIPGVSGNLSTGPSPNNYDTNVVAPTITNAATLFPPEPRQGNRACPLQMIGLTYDWSSLNTLVNQMTPNGSTNQNIGLVWAWQSLVGGGPLTAPAMDSSYQYQQVIILLSDGLNTQDRWYGNGSDTSTQVDARQQLTCSNIKAAGITLYTVQVNTGGDPTSTLLQNCATDASKFFLLTNANAIITTFKSIGTQISKLRIAK
jgi:hypothetical protein